MAKVINFYGKERKNFKSKIILNEEELIDLILILVNSKSLMKLWDEDHEQNEYEDCRTKINKLLEEIRYAENQFED